MSLLSRLFRKSADPRDAMRPLWYDVVAVSREREWYASCGVADSVEGRFDMISVVLALVLLRMENSAALGPSTALITELFVEDMDGQLREAGVGDLMVGKKMVKLMGVLGGRLGALRETLALEDDVELAEALQRNVALVKEETPLALATRCRALHAELTTRPDEALLDGKIRS